MLYMCTSQNLPIPFITNLLFYNVSLKPFKFLCVYVFFFNEIQNEIKELEKGDLKFGQLHATMSIFELGG